MMKNGAIRKGVRMRHGFTSDISITIPSWISGYLERTRTVLATALERMDLVIELARKNIEHKTGGPFAAAVFNTQSGELISAGVNLVTRSNLSVCHAEILAIMQAQTILGNFDLGAPAMPCCQLVTSTAPCAMCLGALPWSGVKELVCGARDEDARSVGFDEGAKCSDWIEQLQKRGIQVITDISRTRASEVLRAYALSGGVIYNGRAQK